MAILPDHRLRALGPTLLDPFDPNMVQPASIDVHIDKFFFRAERNHFNFEMDPSQDNSDCFEGLVETPRWEQFEVHPGEFVLASTYEKITVPHDLVGRFEGKSSLARLGLLTHITAGYIDPGFEGHITLELKNVTELSWFIEPGMKIGQVVFEELTDPVQHAYGDASHGSHYQGQRGPTLSRSHIGFSKIDIYQTTERRING